MPYGPPIVWHIVGADFLQVWGVGVVRITLIKNPSKSFQEGVNTEDALGFPGLKDQFQGPGRASCSGNERLQ